LRSARFESLAGALAIWRGFCAFSWSLYRNYASIYRILRIISCNTNLSSQNAVNMRRGVSCILTRRSPAMKANISFTPLQNC
jgi:hypothetical protein